MQNNEVLFQNTTTAYACLSTVLFLNFLPICLKPFFFFCNLNKLSIQGINNNNKKAKFSFQIVINKQKYSSICVQYCVLQYGSHIQLLKLSITKNSVLSCSSHILGALMLL